MEPSDDFPSPEIADCGAFGIEIEEGSLKRAAMPVVATNLRRSLPIIVVNALFPVGFWPLAAIADLDESLPPSGIPHLRITSHAKLMIVILKNYGS